MFKFLKKSGGQAPPDVGQEDVFDEKNNEADGVDEGMKLSDKIENKVPAVVTKDVASTMSTDSLSNLEVERINSRIESIVTWINQFYERFSYVSENIGELRAMNLANEKKILDATKDAEKVIDVVREVKPEQLRLDYQKIDIRIKTFEEKVAANKQFTEDIMKEVEDIRRKSDIFVGTDALIKLNSDTKKDLVEMQKINSKTKMQGDKAQAIFMELKKGFAESQKSVAIIDNLESSYSGIKDELEKIKLNHATVVRQDTFNDFKKTFGNKISVLNGLVTSFDNLKKENNSLGKAVEASLAISRRNEEDIGNIALKVGDDNTKRIEDYENQINDLVGVVETLAIQVSELKKKINAKPVSVKIPKKAPILKKVVPVVKKKVVSVKKKVSNSDELPSIDDKMPDIAKITGNGELVVKNRKNIPRKKL